MVVEGALCNRNEDVRETKACVGFGGVMAIDAAPWPTCTLVGAEKRVHCVSFAAFIEESLNPSLSDSDKHDMLYCCTN